MDLIKKWRGLILVFTIFVAMGVGDKVLADNSGINEHNYNNSNVSVIVTQPDGKILIGGHFDSYNGVSRSGIARLNRDGNLDTTFNSGVGVDGPFFGNLNQVDAIAIQNDGKIIIGGYFTTYGGLAVNSVARLNLDGSLDTTFNPGAGLYSQVKTINAIAIQSDGKIIIGGNFTSYDGVAKKYLARLNVDGSLDAEFNSGAGFGPDYSEVSSLAIEADNKIIVGGNFATYNGVAVDGLARLNPNGSIDETFNPGSSANGSGNGTISSINIQSNGKLIIGGAFATYNNIPRNGVARLNPDGILDESFDPNPGTGNYILGMGVLTGPYMIVRAATQQDGKVIVFGHFSHYNNIERSYMARLNLDGSLDVSFNPRGSVPNTNAASVAAVQSDGRILIGGYRYFTRLNSDGALDTAFNAADTSLNSIGDVVGVRAVFPVEDIAYNTLVQPTVEKMYFALAYDGGAPTGLKAGVTVTSTPASSFALTDTAGRSYTEATVASRRSIPSGEEVIIGFTAPFRPVTENFTLNLAGQTATVQVKKHIETIDLSDRLIPSISGGVWTGFGVNVKGSVPLLAKGEIGASTKAGASVGVSSGYVGELSYGGFSEDTLAIGYPTSAELSLAGGAQIGFGGVASAANLDASFVNVGSEAKISSTDIDFPFKYNIQSQSGQISQAAALILANIVPGSANNTSRYITYYNKGYVPYKHVTENSTSISTDASVGTFNFALGGSSKSGSTGNTSEAKWDFPMVDGGLAKAGFNLAFSNESGTVNGGAFNFNSIESSMSFDAGYVNMSGGSLAGSAGASKFYSIKAGQSASGAYAYEIKTAPGHYYFSDHDKLSFAWEMDSAAFSKMQDADGSTNFSKFDEVTKNSTMQFTARYEPEPANFSASLGAEIGAGVGMSAGVAVEGESAMSIPVATYGSVNGEQYELGSVSQTMLESRMPQIRSIAENSAAVIGNSLYKSGVDITKTVKDMLLGLEVNINTAVNDAGNMLTVTGNNLGNAVTEVASNAANGVDNFFVSVRQGFMNPPAEVVKNGLILASDIVIVEQKNPEPVAPGVTMALHPRTTVSSAELADVNAYAYKGGWQLVPAARRASDNAFVFDMAEPGIYALFHAFPDDGSFFYEDVVTLSTGSSTMIKSRPVLMSNGAIAAGQQFTVTALKSGSVSVDGQTMTIGASPVTIPAEITADAAGRLKLPLAAGIEEGEAYLSIDSKIGTAKQIVRVIVSKGKTIDESFDFKIKSRSAVGVVPVVGQSLVFDAITSNRTENVIWTVSDSLGHRQIATGSVLTFVPNKSGVYKISAVALDNNGFAHQVYAEMPITDSNNDFDKNGLSSDLERYFGINPNIALSGQNSAATILDVAPPRSTSTISTNQKDPAIITLQAKDEGGSGVEKIEYSFNAGKSWDIYTGPIAINKSGKVKLSFRAIDRLGNVEEVRAVDYIVNVEEKKITDNHEQNAGSVLIIGNIKRVVNEVEKIIEKILPDHKGRILGVKIVNNYVAERKKIIDEEKTLVKKDSAMAERLRGKILIQVENRGQAWYVNPDSGKKYFLGRPADAFNAIRSQGLGVRNSVIKYTTYFPDRFLGKILINVENAGKAYYVSPKDRKAYFLGKPTDAFDVMRRQGIGISNADIRKIEVGG